MAKLPGIVQQSVAEFQKGYIPQPNFAAEGRAGMSLISGTAQAIQTIKYQNGLKEVDEASGNAATELSELRAQLENQATIPADQVPSDILAPLNMTTTEGLDGRKEISRPFVYTHEIANEIWAKRSAEIVDHHAQTIGNARARAKFRGEITERYIAPGTASIVGKSILDARALGQAQAESTMMDIAASVASPADRETAMREVIARQFLAGGDPVWAEEQYQAIGPAIDQFDVQQDIMAAQNIDQLDQVEERMWAGGTRMSPPQIRTMGEQVQKRRTAMRQEEAERQSDNAEQMLATFLDPNAAFGETDVQAAVANGDISLGQAWTFRNALQSGSTTRASDPFALSQYRGAIVAMQYTGNQNRVTDRARLLRVSLSRATMGLNPDGSPNPLGATISGEDALRLDKDINAAMDAALENNDYDNALKDLMAWTRVRTDLEGNLVQTLGGNQNTVDAALAFKQSLDNYMDNFGIDAKATEFVNANKDAFSPLNFTWGVNARFLDQVNQSQNFMTETETEGHMDFTVANQEQFTLWLAENRQAIGEVEYNRIWSLFNQYYLGQGIAPQGGALMLEGDDPMYRQFEAFMMPDLDQ